MAPATKYGGKIVVCQPGSCATAKSNDTMVCTQSTSGVASPASSRYAVRHWCQCRASPPAHREQAARTGASRGAFAVSRAVARSGISPRYQNSTDTVR